MPGITINSKLDTKPVLQGAADMNRAIQSLKRAVAQAGKNMNASVVGYAKAMQNNAVAASDVNKRVSDLRETYETILKQVSELANARIDTQEYADLKKEIKDTEKALEKLQEKQKQIRDLGKDVVPTREYAQNRKQLDSLRKKYDEQERKYTQTSRRSLDAQIRADEINEEIAERQIRRNDLIDKRNEATQSGRTVLVDKYNTQIQQEATAIQELVQEYNAAIREGDRYYGVLQRIEEQQEVRLATIQRLEEVQEQLVQSGGDTQQSEAMRQNQYEIQKTTDLLQKQQQQQKDMEASGKATVAGETTKEYGEMLSRAAAAEEKLSEAVKEASEVTKPLYIKEWEKMSTITGTVANGFARLQNAAQTAGYAIHHPLEALDRILPVAVSGFANLAKNIVGVAVSLGKMAVSTVVSAFQRLASSAINAAMGFARMASSAVVSFVKRLGNAARTTAVQLAGMVGRGVLKGLQSLGRLTLTAGKALVNMGRSAKSSNGGLKQSLTMILRYTLGIRSLFMLVRRLRSAIIDAFKNMAKKVPEVNTAISSLTSSLDLLKNSLATAFQPILSVIAPYLSQFMDMLSGALTQVGMFFAALTGQGYVYKATKAQIDYAKSLDNTKKKAKEAENQLAGFDHLNILSDNSQNDSDSDKNETPTAGFEKVPVDSKIKDFVKKLLDAFKNGELYKIGKQFADLVNNIIENVIKWEKIGKTFGKVINGIVDVYNGFMENVKWEELGKGLGKAFDGLLDTVKWGDLGKAFSQKINALFGILWGFVQDKERWKKAGKALAEMAWGYFGNIKWDLIAKTIGTAINGIASLIIEFAENFPWGEMGEKIRAGFALLVSTIDIDEVYTAFSKLVGGLLDLITPILTDTTTWNKIAADFKEFVHRFFTDEELWSKATTAIKGAFRTLISSLNVVFGDQTLFEEIGGRLATFLNDLMGDKEMWDGIGQLANDMMKDVLSFGKKFIDGFDPETAANNIKSALEQIKWKDIANDTWNLLKSAISKAGSFVDALFSESTDGLTGAALSEANAFNAKPIGARMAIKFKEVFADTGLWEDIAKTVWGTIQGAFTMAGDFISALLGIDSANMNAEERLEAIGTAIGEKLSEFAGVIAAELPRVFETIGTLLQGLVAGLLGDESGNGKLLLWIAGGIAALKLGIIPMILKLIAGLASGFAAGGHALAIGLTAALGVAAAAGIVKLAEITGQLVSAQQDLNKALTSEMDNGMANYIYLWRAYGEDAANAYASSVYQIKLSGDDLSGNLEQIGRRIAEVQGTTFDNVETIVADAMGTYKAIVKTDSEEAAKEWALNALQIELSGNDTSENLQQLSDTIKQYAGNSKSTADIVKEACDSITIDVIDTAGTVETTVSDSVENVKTTTSEAGKEIHDNYVNPYAGIPEEIQPELDAIGQAINQATGDIVGDVESHMNEQSRVVDIGLKDITNIVDTGYASAGKAVGTNVSGMESDVASGMSAMTQSTLSGTTEQREPIYENWDLIATYVKYSMLGMVNDVRDGMNEMVGIMQTTMGTISRLNWDYIGTGIVNGIARGINNGWNWLNNMVWNLAVSLFNTAKAALGIASPSKAFYFVGDMVGAGIAEGIGDSKDDVLGSLEGINNAMVKEGNALTLSVSDQELKDLFATMVTIADETQDEIKSKSWGSIGEYITNGIRDGIATGWEALESFVNDRIDSLYSSFNDRLQAMADNVSFRMPSIAAGTVVPYAVQANSVSAAPRDATTVLEQNNEELIRVIIQAVNEASIAVVRAIQDKQIDFNIGDKVIGDASIREINRRTRAFGVSPLEI